MREDKDTNRQVVKKEFLSMSNPDFLTSEDGISRLPVTCTLLCARLARFIIGDDWSR
jgi:hypothetical protein